MPQGVHRYRRLVLPGFGFGGAGQNRTAVDGFAIRCIATLLPRLKQRESLRIPVQFFLEL
jgi:hypothetical protein